MTKNGRISAVCFAIASFALVSCSDLALPGPELSNLVGASSKPKDELVVVKPPPISTIGRASAALSTPNVKEGAAEAALQTPPLASASRQASSLMSVPDIRQLIGLNISGLNRQLGKPLLVRREVGAEVWQYRTANCVLHLFLYRDAAKEPYRVVHVEVNHSKRINAFHPKVNLNSSAQTTLIKSCYSRLLNNVRGLRSSS